MLIKKGMQVRVISGAHKGSEGKVLFVSPKKQRVVVEGVNFIKKSTRPSQENQSGGIVEKEASLHVSNIAIFNAETNKGDRVGISVGEDGSKKRIFKSNGSVIDQ